ncbi:MAG: sporulation protein YunB [Bacilli bacterium]
MNKMNLKRKIKIKPINKIIIILIILIIMIITSLKVLDKKIMPTLMNYVELEIKRLSTLVITKAVNKHVANDLDIEKLFIINKDNEGQIKTIDFNSTLVNKFLTTTTSNVQISLRQIENGKIDIIQLSDEINVKFKKKHHDQGIIFEVPMGIVWNNAFLSNLGPKIPVRLNIVGDITSNIKTKVTNYGINNALIEVFIIMKIDEQVILPFISKKISIKSDIPIALKLIQGTVPNYYVKGMNQQSPLVTLPIE